MKFFLYVLVLIMLATGGHSFFFGDRIFVSWIHYAAGFCLSAIFLLFGMDHTSTYKRYATCVNYALVSGILLWGTGGAAILSGFFVFFYDTNGTPMDFHRIASVLFGFALITHIVKKK